VNMSNNAEIANVFHAIQTSLNARSPGASASVLAAGDHSTKRKEKDDRHRRGHLDIVDVRCCTHAFSVATLWKIAVGSPWLHGHPI
ncbi:MAG: hypothetical protein VX035_01985, partial [Planctomycetota bacterium]|nr:hypothetical protein [Planctomycetota bacterium]